MQASTATGHDNDLLYIYSMLAQFYEKFQMLHMGLSLLLGHNTDLLSTHVVEVSDSVISGQRTS